MTYHHQQGVSLIITFFVMTMIIAIVFSLTTILVNEIKITAGIGNSVISFYAADTSIEKTLYFDRKQLLVGANRGLCNICTVCNDPSVDSHTYCNSCTTTPLAVNGCDLLNCINCQVNYSSAFGGTTNTVFSTVSPDPIISGVSNFLIDSKGFYKDVTRQIEFNSTAN